MRNIAVQGWAETLDVFPTTAGSPPASEMHPYRLAPGDALSAQVEGHTYRFVRRARLERFVRKAERSRSSYSLSTHGEPWWQRNGDQQSGGNQLPADMHSFARSRNVGEADRIGGQGILLRGMERGMQRD